jgi:tetratricopeptide (TPR) repeat protein
MAEVLKTTLQGDNLPEYLAIVMKWRDAGTPPNLETWNQVMGELQGAFEGLSKDDSPLARLGRAIALMVMGNLLRERGMLNEALQPYDESLREAEGFDLCDDRLKHEKANLITNRSICLLSMGRGDEALAGFDEAIELRKDLPDDPEHSFMWGLSAGWMNRADALVQLGKEGTRAQAVEAFDHAIEILEKLPYEQVPMFRWRLGLAWSNRGLIVEARDEALHSFNQSIAILEAGEDMPALMTGAAAIVNRARALAGGQDFIPALADCRLALAKLASAEREHPQAAQFGLIARHVLAKILCTWLDEGQQGEPLEADWISTTTDTVEEALELERLWEQRGLPHFRPIALELYALGLRVYRVCQPHFLAEFLLEGIDPDSSPGAPANDPNFIQVAAAELQLAMSETVERAASTTLEPEKAEKQRKILQQLKYAESRLSELVPPPVTVNA